MPFDSNTQGVIQDYVSNHLPDEEWYRKYFDFVSDFALAHRLAEEFMSARYLYKLLEGLGATDWLQRTQVRTQILQYASIYEAVIHYLLFDKLKDSADIISLITYKTLKRISIPQESLSQLEKALCHDGKKIVPTYETTDQIDQSKVRFDKKVLCVRDLGLVPEQLARELIEIYEARNAIHIHAELRKSLAYELDLSKLAYRRMEPFRDSVVTKLTHLGLYK